MLRRKTNILHCKDVTWWALQKISKKVLREKEYYHIVINSESTQDSDKSYLVTEKSPGSLALRSSTSLYLMLISLEAIRLSMIKQAVKDCLTLLYLPTYSIGIPDA